MLKPRILLVVLMFVVLAAALTWPLVLNAGNSVEDRHDALLNVWILAWDGHQLLTDPLHLFDANIFYPYRNTLAFSEIVLPQALLALPFTLATGNPVLGYNVALLASFALSGLAAFLLVLRATRSAGAGLAAGIVFAFNAYKLSNLAQAQLLALQWLPLAILYLDRTLLATTTRRSARERWRPALLLALFTALQALSSFYYAMLSMVTAALFVVVAGVVQRRAWRAGNMVRTVIAFALAALIVAPFVAPYLDVERTLNFRRAVAESIPFSASLAQYAQSPANSLLYGGLSAQTPVVIGGYPLDALFPGVATLLLALAGFVAWRRQARAWAFAVLLALVSFLLSLGPTLTLSPGQEVSLPFPMPYRLLFELPVMHALRAPVRFAALVFLGLSMLVGLGVAAVQGTRAAMSWPRRVVRSVGVLVLLAVLLAEVTVFPAARIANVPTGAAVPAIYRWLAEQERGGIIELPMTATSAGQGLLNQYYSIYHWLPTPDGYSGFVPPKHGEVAYEMQFFPSERSLSMLQALDVRYVLIHSGLLLDWNERTRRLADYGDDIQLIRQFGDSLLYRLAQRSAEANVHAYIYLPKTGQDGQPYVASLIVTNVAAHSFVTAPTRRVLFEATWRAADTSIVRLQRDHIALPIVISEAAAVPITLQPPAEGAYNLTIKAALDDAFDASDATSVTIQRLGAPQAQALPVRLTAGAADKTRYAPGETMRVALRWRALGKVDAYYSVFVRLLDKNGEALVQRDGQPSSGSRPTLFWQPGEEIDDDWTLPLPASAPPGRYVLEAGIYRPDDLSARLTLNEIGEPIERLLLGDVRIALPLDVASPPSLPASATFGNRVALVGYDIEGCVWQERTCHAPAGGQLAVTLHWRADNDMASDYTAFVHLAGADGVPVAQDDAQPRQGRYPTSVWQRGDEIADRHVLSIPASLPPGRYRLVTGLYDPATGLRLAVQGNDAVADAVRLVEIAVSVP